MKRRQLSLDQFFAPVKKTKISETPTEVIVHNERRGEFQMNFSEGQAYLQYKIRFLIDPPQRSRTHT
jgi:hypothetical protein